MPHDVFKTSYLVGLGIGSVIRGVYTGGHRKRNVENDQTPRDEYGAYMKQTGRILPRLRKP